MQKYIGDIPDPRSKKAKKKDFLTAEVDMGVAKFVTKKQAEKVAKKYIERNQYQKGSCVPSSMCNALFDTEKVAFADEPNYTLRVNKPQMGCWWGDQADLVINRGMNKRVDVKELKTEKEANALFVTGEMDDKAKPARQKSYLWIKERDFNNIATWINSGYAVPFSIYAEIDEWSLKQPKVIYPDLKIENAYINHAICAIPNTAYKTKDGFGFFITDSSPFGGHFKRDITQTFYEKRMKHGIVFEDLKFEQIEVKLPFKYHWTRDLDVGDGAWIENGKLVNTSKGYVDENEHKDVLKLQQALQWLGHFPATQKPTGYFGGITRQAVKDFQEKYKTNILISIGLQSGTGYFGASSQKQMYKLM